MRTGLNEVSALASLRGLPLVSIALATGIPAFLASCAGHVPAAAEPSTAAMAIVQDVEVDEESVQFPAMSTETQQHLALIADRFAVTGFSLDADMGLKSVSIQLVTAENLPWTSLDLREIVLGPGGTVDSWLEADPDAAECQLHAEVSPTGVVTLSCAGDCPEDFPVCSLTPVSLPNGGKTQYFCLCKRLIAE